MGRARPRSVVYEVENVPASDGTTSSAAADVDLTMYTAPEFMSDDRGTDDDGDGVDAQDGSEGGKGIVERDGRGVPLAGRASSEERSEERSEGESEEDDEDEDEGRAEMIDKVLGHAMEDDDSDPTSEEDAEEGDASASDPDSADSEEEDDSASTASSSASSSATIRALLQKARAKYDAPASDKRSAFGDEDVIRFGEDSDDEEAQERDEDHEDEDEVVIVTDQRRIRPSKRRSGLEALAVPPGLDPLPPLTTHSAGRTPSATAALSKTRPSMSASATKAKTKLARQDRFGLPPPREPLLPSERKLLRTLPPHRLPPSLAAKLSSRTSPSSNPTSTARKLPFHELPLSDTADPLVKREIQALRLHNSLDPKRFYRGGGEGGNGKGKGKRKDVVPERMVFGHVVDSGMGARVGERGPQQSAVKKRSFMEALVADEQAKAYAKKKFVGEVQKRAESGGKLFYKRLQQKRRSGRR